MSTEQKKTRQTQEQRNKYVLGCLISWLAQSNGGISINDATTLLNELEPDDED